MAADAEEAERGQSVRVRVGVSQTAAAEIMPPALQVFRDEHPGLEVVLSEVDDDPEDVRVAFRKGLLDFAFTHNPEPDEFIEAVPVLEDSWVILTRRDSAMAEMTRPGFDALDGLDLVAWTQRWRVQVELEDAWSRRGISPRIVYRTDDNLALQRLVAAGLGHACIGAAGRASCDRFVAHLDRAPGFPEPAHDCSVLSAAPADDGSFARLDRRHPRAGSPVTPGDQREQDTIATALQGELKLAGDRASREDLR